MSDFTKTKYESETFPVPAEAQARAWIDADKYEKMYAESVNNPEAFWGEQAKRLDWIKFPSKIKDTSFSGDVHIK